MPAPGEGLLSAKGQIAIPCSTFHLLAGGGLFGGEIMAGGFNIAGEHPVEAAFGDIDLGLGGGPLLAGDFHLEIVLHGDPERFLQGEPLGIAGGLGHKGMADQQNGEHVETEHHHSLAVERTSCFTSAF